MIGHVTSSILRDTRTRSAHMTATP
jgi:hypothetical protein